MEWKFKLLHGLYSIAMFTLYHISFNAVLESYTGQYEQIFFAVMMSMVLKIFNIKHVLDKSKR